MSGWDADRYQRQFGFVSAMADGVLELLDAVFSNAALHWMPRPGEVVGRVRAAVRPGGRFVAEMGGAGNIAEILAAVGAALAEAGLPEPASPWYFPTPAQQAALLPRVLARVDELAAPRLRCGGEWFADYWRLRFLAIADPPATGRVEYPPGRRRGWSEPLR